jgi:hypothetical protein
MGPTHYMHVTISYRPRFMRRPDTLCDEELYFCKTGLSKLSYATLNKDFHSYIIGRNYYEIKRLHACEQYAQRYACVI